MGANTRSRTCEHDKGYYGYVDASMGVCPYCQLRAVEKELAEVRAENTKARELMRSVVDKAPPSGPLWIGSEEIQAIADYLATLPQP